MLHDLASTPDQSPRITRKRQARMQQILDTALAVAREEGRDALTLQRLAERLAVTPAALYRYFPSKDALVAELQRSVIAALASATRERANTADVFARQAGLAPGDRALLGVLVTSFAYERFAARAPVEFGLISMYLSTPGFALPEQEAARVFATAWASLQGLADQIQAAAVAGALDPGDANDRAVALWAGLQGVAQTRKLVRSAGERIDPTRITHDLVSTLLSGWGADPDGIERLVDLVETHRFAGPDGSAPPSRAATG